MVSILEEAKRGIPLKDVTIIDCHNHIGYWKAFNAPQNSAEGMLSSMDALNLKGKRKSNNRSSVVTKSPTVICQALNWK